MTPMQMYSWMMLLQKEAEIMPMEDRKPPMIMMGLQPYLFTRILLMGPGVRTHNIIEYIIYYIDVTYFIYIYIYI